MKEPKSTEFNWSDPIDFDETQKVIKDAIEKEWDNYKDKLWLMPVTIFATNDLTDEQKRELANNLFHDKDCKDGKQV